MNILIYGGFGVFILGLMLYNLSKPAPEKKGTGQ